MCNEQMIEQKFNKLDAMIEKYNHMSNRDFSAKFNYFIECLDFVSLLEEQGLIIKEKEEKHKISYLKSILQNDGPEYSLAISFHNCLDCHYEIGVCVRGTPLLKKLKQRKKISWFKRK